METAFSWTAWGIISFWALRTFYYSFSRDKLEQLRKSALGISLAVLILSFLPWLPPNLGGKSGFTLVLEGHILALLFVILLVVSVLLFLTKTPLNLKIAAVATLANTFVLFSIMHSLRPKTFVLTFYDIAPIIAFMLFIVGDLIVILLWQQLQLKNKEGKK